ncbi:MAG: hypothetical protein GF408_03610 [Candidatus Omnitrophica bacterium]|nr:hypothetical protein [Candidatus Omnitrophota bacterium]
MPGNRRSIRLKNYDYTQQGAYYMTICAGDRKCVFGDVRDGEMVLNDAGMMVDKWWRELTSKYSMIKIDEYKIMPNHIHGIMMIVGNDGNNDVGADLCVRPDNGENIKHHDVVKGRTRDIKGQTRRSAPTPTIGTVIQWFKTMSTNEYIKNIKSKNWPAFNARLWQRNFYEHIIRDESDLNRIREYIINNPANWERDEYFQ